MYHLFESEMNDIATFNGMALTCFSFANFMIAVAIGMLTNGAFYTPPRTPLGEYLYSYVSWWLIGGSLIPYAAGVWAVRKKHTRIDQVKNETKMPKP